MVSPPSVVIIFTYYKNITKIMGGFYISENTDKKKPAEAGLVVSVTRYFLP